MRYFRLCAFVCLTLVSSMSAAGAHPLGNFTINHLSELKADRGTLHVRYVLDMAEIPAFAVARSLSASGRMNARELAAWGDAQTTEIAHELTVTAGGVPQRLAPAGHRIRVRPGAGGLDTIYLVADYAVALPADAANRIAFTDATYPGRLGWRNVIVAPMTEPTHELTSYPSALLGSPPDIVAATFTVAASGVIGAVERTGDTAASGAAAPVMRSNLLSDMLARGTGSLGVVLLTFAAALALGALHALEPGHGKTLLAITLVGARATKRQALILAGSLTFAHTIGVLLLGAAVLFLARWIVPEAIYPWITLLSGVAVAILGARALAGYVDRRRPRVHAHVHAHEHAHPHSHGHAHGIDSHHHAAHEHGSAHSHHAHDHALAHDHDALDDEAHALAHAAPGEAPLSFGTAAVAAMSGGIAPCPAALVVLLVAVQLHVVLYGLALIVAFSVGLAATLTGLGIAVVRGAGWLSQHKAFERVARYGPLLSAAVIACIGSWMVGEGFVAQGVTPSPAIAAALALLAVAGYAFMPHHARRQAVRA